MTYWVGEDWKKKVKYSVVETLILTYGKGVGYTNLESVGGHPFEDISKDDT